jgi:hypothetical protein
MKSLFNPADNQEIIDRINKLTPETLPDWGKMNVAEMLAHAQQPMKVALGELIIKPSVFGKFFGRFIKNGLLNDEPFKKGLPTAKEFLTPHHGKFEEEKNSLIALIQKFKNGGPDGISKDPHPFFGKMTGDEWDVFQWKHLDHHLRQFGV